MMMTMNERRSYTSPRIDTVKGELTSKQQLRDNAMAVPDTTVSHHNLSCTSMNSKHRVQFSTRPQTMSAETMPPVVNQSRTSDGKKSLGQNSRDSFTQNSPTLTKLRIQRSESIQGNSTLQTKVTGDSQNNVRPHSTIVGYSGSVGTPNKDLNSPAGFNRPHTSHTLYKRLSSSSRTSMSPSTPITNRWMNVSSLSKNVIKAKSRLHSNSKTIIGTLNKNGQQEWKKLHTVHQAVFRDAEDDMESPRAKLIRILKGLRIIIGFCLALKRYAHGATDVDTMLNELESGLADNNTFSMMDLNLDQLKKSGISKPVKHLGQRLRSILYIPPEKRSIEDVRKIFVFLRMLPTFKNWTIPILLNFCKYAVYQKYEPKQVIIKRGHNPEGYYIMLSGTVLVNEWIQDELGNTRHTTVEQTCGDIFGDKELADNSPRQSTVVCRTECELLTATREDYLEVVSGPIQKIMDENIKFLRNLQLFKHFPCEKLSDALAEYSVKLYSKDSVVVTASDLMTNLIIIKTGKCKVVGEVLDKAKPAAETHLETLLRTTFPKEYERRHATEEHKPHTSLELEWETGEMRGVIRANLRMGVRDPERLVIGASQKAAQEKSADSLLTSESGISRIYERMETTKSLRRRQQTEMVPSADPATENTEQDRFVNSTDAAVQGTEAKSQALSGVSRRFKRISKMAQLREQESKKQDEKQPSPGASGGEQKKSQFVVLDRLSPGSVFGLETMFFQCPLRLSLVSEGAECISISKKFFIREGNQKVLNAASEVIIRYPSVVYIRKKVEENRAWAKYKKQLVNDVLKPRLESRESTNVCML